MCCNAFPDKTRYNPGEEDQNSLDEKQEGNPAVGKIGWRKIGMKGLRWMGWRKDKDRRDSFLWQTAVQLPDKLQLKIPNQTRMLTQLAGEKTLLRIATS